MFVDLGGASPLFRTTSSVVLFPGIRRATTALSAAAEVNRPSSSNEDRQHRRTLAQLIRALPNVGHDSILLKSWSLHHTRGASGCTPRREIPRPPVPPSESGPALVLPARASPLTRPQAIVQWGSAGPARPLPASGRLCNHIVSFVIVGPTSTPRATDGQHEASTGSAHDPADTRRVIPLSRDTGHRLHAPRRPDHLTWAVASGGACHAREVLP